MASGLALAPYAKANVPSRKEPRAALAHRVAQRLPGTRFASEAGAGR